MMLEKAIGVTDEGMPIVLPQHCCPEFVKQANGLCDTKECWYCKYADFRKTVDMTLAQSICRCPQNRVAVIRGGYNEQRMV